MTPFDWTCVVINHGMAYGRRYSAFSAALPTGVSTVGWSVSRSAYTHCGYWEREPCNNRRARSNRVGWRAGLSIMLASKDPTRFERGLATRESARTKASVHLSNRQLSGRGKIALLN